MFPPASYTKKITRGERDIALLFMVCLGLPKAIVVLPYARDQKFEDLDIRRSLAVNAVTSYRDVDLLGQKWSQSVMPCNDNGTDDCLKTYDV